MTPEEKRKLLPELFELTKQLGREVTDEDGVSMVTIKQLRDEVRKALNKYGKE